MDGFESIFRDILGVFSNYTIEGDFETIFTDFLGVFKSICTKCGAITMCTKFWAKSSKNCAVAKKICDFFVTIIASQLYKKWCNYNVRKILGKISQKLCSGYLNDLQSFCNNAPEPIVQKVAQVQCATKFWAKSQKLRSSFATFS